MKPDLLGRTHLLYEAAQQLGWADARAIAERARALDRGLPAEDELSVILCWLGKCVFVHKLDQEQSNGPGVKATLYTLLIRRDEDGRGSGLLSWYFGLTKYGYWCSGIVSTPMRARIHNK